jgi:hypothetical protein
LFLIAGALGATYFISVPSITLPFQAAKPSPTPKPTHVEPKVITWSHITFDKYWDLELPSHFEVNQDGVQKGYILSGGTVHGVYYKIAMYFPVLKGNKNHPEVTSLEDLVAFSTSSMESKLKDQIQFEKVKIGTGGAVLALHIPRPNADKKYTGDVYNRAYIWKTPKLNARVVEVVGENGKSNQQDLDELFRTLVNSIR